MATFAGREEGPSCSVEQCFAPPNDGPANDEGDAHEKKSFRNSQLVPS